MTDRGPRIRWPTHPWDDGDPGDDHRVTGFVYDVEPSDGPPPVGIERVTIEPMEQGGVELLAADLLDLLAWAGKEEERDE